MSELTDEEIAAMPSMTDADWEATRKEQEEFNKKIQAQINAKQSALDKLANLGLTIEEAKAVVGI